MSGRPPPGDRTTVWTPEPDQTVVWQTENRDVELLDRTRMWDAPPEAKPTTFSQRYEDAVDATHRDAPHTARSRIAAQPSPDDARPTTFAQRYEPSADDARPTAFAQRYAGPGSQPHMSAPMPAPRRAAPMGTPHPAAPHRDAPHRDAPHRNAPHIAAPRIASQLSPDDARPTTFAQRYEPSADDARPTTFAQRYAGPGSQPHMSAPMPGPNRAAPLSPQPRLAQPQPRLARVPQQPVAMPPPPADLARGSAPSPIGLTPMLEREVFHLARRIALQSDLSAAVRVLRQGLAQLTDADDAVCIFFDPGLCSVWALPDGDAPRAVSDAVQQVVARVAASGERVFVAAAIVEPVGVAPARAVLVVRRAPERPAFGPLELAVVTAIAHAVTGILAHFQADHAARKAQAERDARTPFRPEALAERRRASAAPGKVIAAPRTWIRWAFPTLCALVMGAVVCAVLIQVPAYSTGIAILTVEGEQITSPLPGTVAEVVVAPNARVAAGDPLVRARAVQEDTEAAAAETDYRNALALFLSNPGDDGARTGLAALATRRQRAKAAVEARTIRATTAGIVGDVRVHAGQLLVPGGEIMKISPEGAAPSVIALLPGTDRPRLAPGMTVQIELPGYRKKREEAVIDSIATQVVGPEEVRRSLGDPIGDALPINGPVVIVRAHLSAKTFEAEGREYELHDGMLGKAEIKVDHQSLLRALFGKGG